MENLTKGRALISMTENNFIRIEATEKNDKEKD